MKKKMNIAIIGLGNIGSYFYNYLKKNNNIIFNKTNTIPNILFVSAKSFNKKRNFTIPKKIWLKNYISATKIKNVDVIVELIGGAEGPAKKLVFEALKNKKHVITANKALVAKYGKGHYVYTGLSFFREFPAGVPGAYRLFANMLSLGK